MTHCICALKNYVTPHDTAELTLYTLREYCKLTNQPAIGHNIKFNPKGDAANIHLFLTEHLPTETLDELKTLLK